MEEKNLEQEGLNSNSSAKNRSVQGEIPVSEEQSKYANLAREHEELQQKYSELNNRYLRLAADLDNYKKRVARDQEMRVNAAVEAFATDILEVADNLERASAAEDENLREGLEQIRKLLMAIFERHEIIPIESLNGRFDPELQEAIAYVPSEHDEGIVIDELIRGYRMKDKVIRCAKVAVSRGNE
jgi:molecular chaperone GrpE